MYTPLPTWSRIGGVLVSVMIATAGFAPAVALAAESPDKSETVHVETDATGGVTSVSVEELLANDAGLAELTDVSTLSGIEPGEDEQSFATNSDGTITWSTNGSSVQYEGESTDELPVKVTVSYTLDGKEVQPADLVGASGHLVMRLDYENKLSSMREVNGTQARIYTPFLCLSAAMLDSDIFSNVTAENARVIDDKGGIAVVGFAMPGLRESLDIDPDDLDLDLPEYLQIEADVTDLAMDPIYTIITPELFGDLDTSDLAFDDLGEGTDALQDAMSQLIDGAGSLSDALHKIKDGNEKLGGGASALQEALEALPTGMTKLKEGATQLSVSLGKASEVSGQLAEGATGLSDAAAGASELVAGASGAVGDAATAVSELGEQVGALGLDDAKATLDDAASAATNAQEAASSAATLLTDASAGNATQKEAAQAALGEAQETLSGMASVLDDESLGLTDEQKAALSSALDEKVTAASGSLSAATTAVGAISTEEPAGLSDKVSALGDAATQLTADAEAIAKASGKVSAVGDGAATALEKLGAASGALAGASAYVDGVATGAGNLYTGISGVASGLESARGGAASLAKALGTLAKQSPQAVKGAAALAEGLEQMTDALEATADGSDQLTEGLSTFNDEGISEIVDALNDLDGDLSGATDRLEALRDAAKEYDNFAGKADGQTGAVRFIYKTAQIG